MTTPDIKTVETDEEHAKRVRLTYNLYGEGHDADVVLVCDRLLSRIENDKAAQEALRMVREIERRNKEGADIELEFSSVYGFQFVDYHAAPFRYGDENPTILEAWNAFEKERG